MRLPDFSRGTSSIIDFWGVVQNSTWRYWEYWSGLFPPQLQTLEVFRILWFSCLSDEASKSTLIIEPKWISIRCVLSLTSNLGRFSNPLAFLPFRWRLKVHLEYIHIENLSKISRLSFEFYLWHFPGSAWLPLSTCQCGSMGVPTCKRLVIFLPPRLDPVHNQSVRQWTPTSSTCPTSM